MIYPALVTILALFMYLWVMFQVGGARKRTGIKAPATSGSDELERYYRVQMNTVEQFVIFLPALWLCADFFRPSVAAIIGLVWVIGRIIYALGYYQEAKKRGLGFAISFLASIALLILALWGIGVRLFLSA